MKEWIKEHVILISVLVFVPLVVLIYFLSPNPEHSLPASNLESEFPDQSSESSTKQLEKKIIMVDLKGAINSPGVFEAEAGERVIDLISRAGGLTERADQSQVNLAMYVEDEMVIYIPEIGEKQQQQVGGPPPPPNAKEDLVNLNSADHAQLETLPGIGPAKSAAIIEYREANGPFKSIEDIKLISGFGEKTFEKLKEKITVK